jgi:glycerol-3-phosphate dehydrogenase
MTGRPPDKIFPLRARDVTDDVFDIAVIGGGINGTGIARDAAGRGYRVVLLEKGDLGGATSAASTKLIHGGLRYLEHGAFRLVKEALQEREVLLRSAPHIIWPLRFVLPHHAGLRPRWMIRLGLFFYDHMGGRKLLPATRSLRLNRDPAGADLNHDYVHAFEYSDCWVDDARLVILNARDAAQRGALVLPHTAVTSGRRDGSQWVLDLTTPLGRESVRARAVVNAAGPWVGTLLKDALNVEAPARVRLVKGSHIVVDRLFAHDRAYMFQNADGRICFAIPYETDFTLIGTTDEEIAASALPVDGSPLKISDSEVTYLLKAVNEYLRVSVTAAAIRWSFAGVRPLYDDGATAAQEATRDYVLDLNHPSGQAALLSVFGGKITTYRRLAEAAMTQLEPVLGRRDGRWTATASLPGGNFPVDGGVERFAQLLRLYPFLDPANLRRMVRAYGTDAAGFLKGVRSADDMGLAFGGGLTAREVDYLMDHEWANTAEDVLWRRTKLGLRLGPIEVSLLDAYIQARKAKRAAVPRSISMRTQARRAG